MFVGFKCVLTELVSAVFDSVSGERKAGSLSSSGAGRYWLMLMCRENAIFLTQIS